MDYKTVIYEKEGNVATITLNRPEKLNVFDFPGQGGLTDDFYSALTEAEEDDDIKVVVIKGAGRAFSAGHDLSTVGFVYGMGTGQPGEPRPSQRRRLKVDRKTFGDNPKRLFLFPKITVAQVHGYCLGEGLQLVDCCDLSIAAEDAQLGLPQNRLAAAGAAGFLPIMFLKMGLARANYLLYTGANISGKEAERVGLVSKAVPKDELEEEVHKLCQALCLLPRDGIALCKENRKLVFDSMGLLSGFDLGYIFHSFRTNVHFEPDEHNFFKARRDAGVKGAIKGRDARYSGLV